MKATVFGEKEKTMSVKFHHLAMAVVGGKIAMVWRVMTNVSEFPAGAGIDRATTHKKWREGSKVMLSLKKGQSVVRVKIDEIEYKDVVAMTITLRDSSSALRLASVKVGAKGDGRTDEGG
jgi:hypothetical protein